MKKFCLSVIILAVSLYLVAGCGNQLVKNADDIDSTEFDEELEEAEKQLDQSMVALPMTKTSFEMSTFIVSVPEGWGTTPIIDPSSSSIMVFKGDMEKIMTSPYIIIDVDELKEGKSFDDTLEAAYAEPRLKAIQGVLIEGKDYRGFEMTEGDTKGVIFYAEQNGKIITVTIINIQPKDPEVLTILKSIRVK